MINRPFDLQDAHDYLSGTSPTTECARTSSFRSQPLASDASLPHFCRPPPFLHCPRCPGTFTWDPDGDYMGPYTLQVVWQIALLGPLEVKRDGQRVEVPSGKASELLVRLSLEAGELCPRGPAGQRPVGITRGRHSTQHTAVEGGHAAPGARRSICDYEPRWRLRAGRRAIPGRCAGGDGQRGCRVSAARCRRPRRR